MAPEGFAAFFLASAGSGGAFVGLLFVAISIGPHRTFGALRLVAAPRQHLAEATLLTLVAGFLLSSVALIPDVNVGWLALFTGAVGAATAGRLTRLFTRLHRHAEAPQPAWKHLLRVSGQSAIACVLFTAQAVVGLLLLLHPSDRDAYRWLAILILVQYTFALFRAWTLLGNPQHGWSGWLNPLQDIERDGDGPAAGSSPR